MPCPTSKDLPPSPSGKTGWPWTEESPQLPDTMPDGSPWPKISVVTPSYNQGQFVEETIRSVLLQGYPNFEYIIIDGGSNDKSVEIIRKYEKYLAYWVSEPDRGQSHALNKGFRRSSGEIIGWLNSDDVYLGEVLHLIACHFKNRPESALIYGDAELIDGVGGFIKLGKSHNPRICSNKYPYFDNRIFQQAVFFKRHLLAKVGYLNEGLQFLMDHDFWIRIFAREKCLYIAQTMAKHRLHIDCKTLSDECIFWPERLYLVKKYAHKNSFYNYFADYIDLYSRSRGFGFKQSFQKILKELKDNPYLRRHVVTEQIDETRTLSYYYLLQAGKRYNVYEFKEALSFLTRAAYRDVTCLKEWRFWHLLIGIFLGEHVVRKLRRRTRH